MNDCMRGGRDLSPAMTAVRVTAGRPGHTVTSRLCLGTLLVGMLLVLAAPGATQTHFRITYNVQSRDAKAIVLEGRVFNETGRDVVDVWVTAEALSASGKVLARGIAFVSSAISRGDSAPFDAKLPAAGDVETFRIAVSSFRAGGEVQSP